ncbi:hypothetical protein [Sphingomonas taxi]|uniref:hypothetical protein n=1 Tax=Sphingomonas taxi TaxID=1549858 RepID=UPI000A52011D|nr:hypothetical protein [Sphingomonas taxi]
MGWRGTLLAERPRPAHRVRTGVALGAVRITKVVLACAHLDHDPGSSAPGNLKALSQRCHILHDAAEHRWQRWWIASGCVPAATSTRTLASPGSS